MKYLFTWHTYNENKEANAIFSTKTTGMSFYDSILNNSGTNIGYQKWEKGLVGSVEYMTPSEYLKRVRLGFKTDEDAGLYQQSQDKIKKAIENGKKIDMPVLFYDENRFEQEGRNRAMVAIELGLDKIPVFVGRRIPTEEKRKMVYTLINNIIKNLKNSDVEITQEIVYSEIENLEGSSCNFFIRQYMDGVEEYIESKI